MEFLSSTLADLHTEKPEHENACERDPTLSLSRGVMQLMGRRTGLSDQGRTHLNQSYKSIIILQDEDLVFLATDINLSGAVDWVLMQSPFGHH